MAALEQWADDERGHGGEVDSRTIGGSPMRTLRHELTFQMPARPPSYRRRSLWKTCHWQYRGTSSSPRRCRTVASRWSDLSMHDHGVDQANVCAHRRCSALRWSVRGLSGGLGPQSGRCTGGREDQPGEWPAVSAAAQAAATGDISKQNGMHAGCNARASAAGTLGQSPGIDNDSLSMLLAQGPATRIGADREIEVELTPDAPCVDHLAWMLNQVPDLDVAAESLTRAERYTGRRLPGWLVEQMAPPTEERQAVLERLGAWVSHCQMMVESVMPRATPCVERSPASDCRRQRTKVAGARRAADNHPSRQRRSVQQPRLSAPCG